MAWESQIKLMMGIKDNVVVLGNVPLLSWITTSGINANG
jgi:hypothetical protein